MYEFSTQSASILPEQNFLVTGMQVTEFCVKQALPILISGNSMLVSQGDGILYLRVI